MNPMFYFLLTLTAVLATTEGSKPVLDSDSKYVLSNESYSVIPLKPNGVDYDGGGLTVFSRGKKCRIYIGVEDSDRNYGVSVTFSDWTSSDKYVPQSKNLNIKMNISVTHCFSPEYWAAGVREEAWFLRAGFKPSEGSFQIKKSDAYMGGYYISYCPDGSDCTRVGTFVDEITGVWHLALNATPAHFAFVRPVIKTSSKTMSIG